MQIKTCPICGNNNAVNSLICIHCDSPFVSGQQAKTLEIPVTLPLNQQQSSATSRSIAARLADMHPHALVFLVAGSSEPILIHHREQVILIGRQTDGGPHVDVDFSPHQAEAFGISRSHACIYQRNGKFVLEDMNSTNGTRLNGGALKSHTPYYVETGDVLRFGQLIVELFFTTAKPQNSTRPLDNTQAFARQG